ncbi:MmcQ/YjbR family DNA-binding protein [Undibacterium sp.]|uniref:MmcQ/YjbR family DNA-binding protein n=1 Tax=Undibacterium sp. TaxID=1914977 RepID=UPI0025E3AEDA|nr:MmcQ/YjbR family DNA-binding protein [Undibacterium sp.]
MNTEQLKDYCSSLPQVECAVFSAPSNILVYSVQGKKFAYFKNSEPEQWRFSLRVTPERFLELTDQAGIKPARYMHRFHWVSIVAVASVDPDYLRELIDWSYAKACSALSKKVQKQLTVGLENCRK